MILYLLYYKISLLLTILLVYAITPISLFSSNWYNWTPDAISEASSLYVVCFSWISMFYRLLLTYLPIAPITFTLATNNSS